MSAVRKEPEDNEQRESIWSVHTRVRRLYFILFVSSLVLGVLYILLVRGVSSADEFFEKVATFGVATAILSLGAAELVGSIMVITEWLITKRDKARVARDREIAARDQAIAARDQAVAERDQARAAKYAEARNLGKDRAFDLWEAWNARRLEAEKNGGDFDEPPPSRETGV